MALKIEEFDVNYITAIGGKSVNGLKFANFKLNSNKFPRIIIYGGMRVEQGKFGNYFELDIKDNKTEEFFKSLKDTLLRVGGGCFGEKPWHIKSPLINYSGSYTVRCKIYPNSQMGNLTLFDMVGGMMAPQNVFDHCAKTRRRRRLKLGDF